MAIPLLVMELKKLTKGEDILVHGVFDLPGAVLGGGVEYANGTKTRTLCGLEGGDIVIKEGDLADVCIQTLGGGAVDLGL